MNDNFFPHKLIIFIKIGFLSMRNLHQKFMKKKVIFFLSWNLQHPLCDHKTKGGLEDVAKNISVYKSQFGKWL